MKSPQFLPVLAPLLALLNASQAAVQDQPASRPNLLLILADDLGYGDVSCYNERAKVATPNIDRLAHEGMPYGQNIRLGILRKTTQVYVRNRTKRFLDNGKALMAPDAGESRCSGHSFPETLTEIQHADQAAAR